MPRSGRSKKIAAKIGGTKFLSYKALPVVLILVVLGAVIIILARAATSVTSFEPESGTLSGPVTKITAGNASGGQAVQFGDTVVTGGGGAYNPDPYCWYHVMGSLYGDGGGNGTANGATWDPNNTGWSFSEPSSAITDRFQRCAQYMIDHNIGGNGVASISISGNSTHLTNFWPAGRNVAFEDGAMTQTVTDGSALAKRAFLMSVIEGEGEKCDPVTTQCSTAQIADNYKTINGATNPTYYEHVTALISVAQGAGLSTAFAATGSGCTPQTLAQMQSGGGAAICIKSSDFQVIKDWPVATCGRVPGFGSSVTGYQCGKTDAP